MLEWLEDRNLFVVSLDEQREWFRYHHLFRDVLRRLLSADPSAEDVARSCTSEQPSGSVPTTRWKTR